MFEVIENFIGLEKIILTILGLIPKVIAGMVVFGAFVLAFRIIRKPLHKALERTGIDEHLINLLIENILRISMLVFGGLMAAGQIGIDVGAALAGLGVLGLAISFAAQDTLSNIIAGFMIYLDKPFKVHDWVKVEGHYGEVWEITIRSTRIKTVNNTYIVIPNKIIIDAVLDNHSKYGETRVDVPVGIAYKEDIDAARDVIIEAVKGLPYILETPTPQVVVDELGDSSVNLYVWVWTKDQSKEPKIHYAVMEASKKALDAAHIQIPYPHLQLFMDDVQPRVIDKVKELVKPT